MTYKPMNEVDLLCSVSVSAMQHLVCDVKPVSIDIYIYKFVVFITFKGPKIFTALVCTGLPGL